METNIRVTFSIIKDKVKDHIFRLKLKRDIKVNGKTIKNMEEVILFLNLGIVFMQNGD